MDADAQAGGERKADHLRIAAGGGIAHAAGTGLDAVRLRHRALPERDLAGVALDTQLLGRFLRAPLVISAMTGGTGASAQINDGLIEAACEHGIAIVLGSGRALLEDPDLRRTYGRGPRPPLLFANLGAGQLDAERALRLVDMLAADGLSIHLNPLQEAVQPEGVPRFAGVVERIAEVVARLAPAPVVVKEVGFGFDAADVRLLAKAGVAAIDVAGAGGTNWALIEGMRDRRAGAVAQAFADWGVPTVQALAEARAAAPERPVIASGGVRNGVEVAKCLALGAAAVGIARPLLIAARQHRAAAAIGEVVEQLRIATWLAGAPSTTALGGEHLRAPR
jgi:isopentenyl-diphosphate delta-isomerase